MKKGIKILLLVVISLMMVGCGCQKEEKKEENTGPQIYKIIELSNDTDKYDKNELQEVGINYELIINDQENAVLKMGSQELKLIYNEKSFITENEDILAYVKSNNRITIDMDGEKMVFEK